MCPVPTGLGGLASAPRPSAQSAAYPNPWLGNLLREQEDQSGLMYRRNRYVDPATGRFTQEDPVGLAGGLNLYGFASGDPVDFDDPLGLWPGWVHDLIIERALHGLASEDDIRAVKEFSRTFDHLTQANADAFKHAMRSEHQTTLEAIQKREAFIRGKVAQAQSDVAVYRPSALEDFAEGAHTRMDETSPAHTDANGLPRIWDWTDLDSWKAHNAEEDHMPSQAQMEWMAGELREMWREIFDRH